MLLFRTELKPSPIQGLGVFTLDLIPAHSIIWRLDRSMDLICKRDTIATLPIPMQEYMVKYGYSPIQDPTHFILECDNGRFMNHSDNPNVDFQDGALAYSRVQIEVGKELTCDYSQFDADFNGRFDLVSTSPRLALAAYLR